MSYANNKGQDQPAHPRSLISAFVVCCLDSVISLVSVTKISSLTLASVTEQLSWSLTWSETPEDMFCHDKVQMISCFVSEKDNVCRHFCCPYLAQGHNSPLSHLMRL